MDTAPPVLVVDNSSTVRLILIKHLDSLGFYDVDVAEDGRSALECLSKRQYGLLISDWEMQPMGGEQLLKALRNDPKFFKLPIILVTAKSSRGAAWNAGANAYLSKPFTEDEFNKAIQLVFHTR